MEEDEIEEEARYQENEYQGIVNESTDASSDEDDEASLRLRQLASGHGNRNIRHLGKGPTAASAPRSSPAASTVKKEPSTTSPASPLWMRRQVETSSARKAAGAFKRAAAAGTSKKRSLDLNSPQEKLPPGSFGTGRDDTATKVDDEDAATAVAVSSTKKKRVGWSEAEMRALRKGVTVYGRQGNKWACIKADPQFQGLLSGRSNVDLKDKWRTIHATAQAVAAAHAPIGNLPRTTADARVDINP